MYNPTNKNIDSPECKEALAKARTIVTDKKYHELGKEGIRTLVRYVIQHKSISQIQLGYMENYWSTYQRIKTLNDGFEPGLPEYTTSILEEVSEFSKPYRKGNSALANTLKAHACNNSKRLTQIKNGEYFWITHILPASSAITAIKKQGINVEDLEKKINDLHQKLTIPQ